MTEVRVTREEFFERIRKLPIDPNGERIYNELKMYVGISRHKVNNAGQCLVTTIDLMKMGRLKVRCFGDLEDISYGRETLDLLYFAFLAGAYKL